MRRTDDRWTKRPAFFIKAVVYLSIILVFTCNVLLIEIVRV